MFSYRVWLTAGDLSPALGPSLALPAHPDEGQSPWTWDSRLLGGNKTAEVVSPCPQPSMLWKPTPHHQHRLEDTNKKCFKQTRRSPTYSRSEKSDVALQKVLVEISLFVVFFFLNINLLQNFTWRSFIHIHTIFYRYRYALIVLSVIYGKRRHEGQFTFQTWQLRCFRSDLFPSSLPPTRFPRR